jgi:outer membrane protein assembly factor BamA
MRFSSKTFLFFLTLSSLCFAIFLESCTVVKNYPKNKPFVYQNKVRVEGNISKDEKKRLTEELNNYWDDSMKANWVQQFGFIYKIKNPPIFDSNNILQSRAFMNAYLNSQGYYRSTYKSYYRINTVKHQIRATVGYNISIGKIIRIDTVAYKMYDSTQQPVDSSLQKLTLEQAKNSIIKKGQPYTKESVNNELDRLTSWYHQKGYFKFTRDNIYALIDTLDEKFLKLSLDPFKEAELIADAEKRSKENAYWNITIAERKGKDSLALQPFYVGKVYYYPDIKNAYYNPDATIARKDFLTYTHKEATVFYNENKYFFRPIREHTYLHNGELYNEEMYYKTINRLSQIGTWKQVDIKPVIRDKDSIDLYIFMVPEKKQSFTVDQEVSNNTGEIGSGNLLGIATNFSYKNRNIWNESVQSLTTLRFGFEFNIDNETNAYGDNSVLQTTQVNLSHTYIFPRLIQPIKHWAFLDKLDNKRTLFNIAAGYTDRKALYGLKSLVTSIGHEFSYHNNTWLFKPLNVELYKVDTLAGLDSLFKTTPFLRNSFKDGKVVGVSLSYSRTIVDKHDPTKSHYFRFGYEESGAIINQLVSSSLGIYNYNKIEGEYRFIKKFQREELASRFFTGVGLHGDQAMPVFKQYFLGGPNSMRAWGLRQLGLGSSLASDTSTSGYTDRYGDLAIEGNLEYRFLLGTINGIKIGSAIYTDVGNIWDIKKQADDPDAYFKFSRLGKDLAIGVGTGLRVDFNYFLIRIDMAYRVKDPARVEDGGWMSIKNFEWTDTRQNGVEIHNYAFQLGIGLPF